MKKIIGLVLALAIVNARATSPAPTLGGAQVKYTVVSLPSFYPSGNNDRGQIYGTLFVPATPAGNVIEHGAIWQNGVFKDLGSSEFITKITDFGEILARDNNQTTYIVIAARKMIITFPRATYTDAVDINNLGVVTGSFSTSSDGVYSQAFYWFGGVYHKLNVVGTPNARVINDFGEIAGNTALATPPNSSGQNFENILTFIWKNGTYQLLLMPNKATFARPTGINIEGNVVGLYQNVGEGGNYHGFYYANGSVVDIGSLGRGASMALAINNWNQVVGFAYNYEDDPYLDQAVLYEKGVLTDLNTLIPVSSGWKLEYASGINNLGQIVGYGNKGGFLLNPIR